MKNNDKMMKIAFILNEKWSLTAQTHVKNLSSALLRIIKKIMMKLMIKDKSTLAQSYNGEIHTQKIKREFKNCI